MGKSTIDEGSFRDPSGHVFVKDGRVFRTIARRAVSDYEALRDSGLLKKLFDAGLLVSAREVERCGFDDPGEHVVHIVEHPRLPFIAYPYEWPFSALKSAALFHLDLHLQLLAQGATFRDASAYNVQFNGVRPVFIDLLSLRPYQDGEYWLGHKQFCEQFLNPLLLTARLGVPYHAWYRGTLEGIATADLARVLPLRHKLDWRTLVHVVFPAHLQARAARSGDDERITRAVRRPLPLHAYQGLLRQLRGWIAGLEPRFGDATTWAVYDEAHGYERDAYEAKRRFVARFVDAVRPKLLWDLGCNTGAFSELALEHGARHVIGFDYDHGALEKAFRRASDGRLDFLPLFLDAANPSPDQGWRQRERRGLARRGTADALIALAFEHHLAIGRNVPLPDLVAWLTELASRGVVEFVEKSDPRIRHMLKLREDIFDGYNKPAFEAALRRRARIVEVEVIPGGSRTMYRYERED